MFPAETIKAPHDSNNMEFMWWGKCYVVPYFSTQVGFAWLGPLSLGRSLAYSPDFNTKGWMFWCSIWISARSLKCMSCPYKNIIRLLIREVLHTMENWATDLSHLSLYIYPYGVWWTVHPSGLPKWKYWDYSFAWCTIMGSMKHFQSDQVRTSNVHQNGALYQVLTFYICSPENK